MKWAIHHAHPATGFHFTKVAGGYEKKSIATQVAKEMAAKRPEWHFVVIRDLG